MLATWYHPWDFEQPAAAETTWVSSLSILTILRFLVVGKLLSCQKHVTLSSNATVITCKLFMRPVGFYQNSRVVDWQNSISRGDILLFQSDIWLERESNKCHLSEQGCTCHRWPWKLHWLSFDSRPNAEYMYQSRSLPSNLRHVILGHQLQRLHSMPIRS